MNSKLLHDLEYNDIPLLTNSQLRFLNEANSVIENVISVRSKKSTSSGRKDPGADAFVEKVKVLEENFTIIMNRLRTAESAKGRFVRIYPRWKKVRSDTIQALKEIAKTLNLHRFNCNVSKLVGFSTSIVGGGFLAASAALTFLTMGLATPLLIAGGSFTAAGVGATFGTSVTEFALVKNAVNKAQEIITKDRKWFEKMCDWLTHADELQTAVDEVLNIDPVGDVVKAVKKFIDDALNIVDGYQRHQFIRKGIGKLFNLVPESIRQVVPPSTVGTLLALLIAFYLLFKNSSNRLVFDSAALTIRSILGIGALLDDAFDVLKLAGIFKGLSGVAAKAATRGAVAVVGIGLDIAGMALTSIDVHNGSISPEATKIKTASLELEKEAEVLDKVFEKLH